MAVLTAKSEEKSSDSQQSLCAVGIDLAYDYVQFSYCSNLNEEPLSLSTNPEDKKYLIPTVLYYREENKTWYIGEEALYNSFSDKKESVKLWDKIETDEEVLSIFLKEIIEKAKSVLNFDFIENICVSIECYEKTIVKNIFKAFLLIGYDEQKIRVINHDEAFIYYTINQKKELWLNDVVLFDFSKKHFVSRRLHEIKSKTPPILVVDSEILSNDISYSLLDTEHGKRKADSRLLEYVQKEFKKNIVCTVFLTGTGFYDEWATDSLPEICSRRRVFKGYNLFVKGACYAALKKAKGITKNTHTFSCYGRTKAEIGLLINNQGKNMVISLSKAGTNWYEAGAEAECILDNVSKINLVIYSALESISTNYILDLDEFPSRPNKTTRVRITLGYINDDTFEIIIKDLGFGDLFKSSGRIIKKTISNSKLFNI